MLVNLKKHLIIFILIAVCFPSTATPARADGLPDRLKGRILLAVESRGEAWYVSPEDKRRYYLGRPADAFDLMRRLGIGITNSDLRRIAVGLTPGGGPDTDGDGLPDALERALGADPYRADTDGDGYSDRAEIESGHDPLGPGRLPLDRRFAAAQSGRIFLQVEGRGEAWYVNPADHKRYFLGRPDDAFALMRSFGLGIINRDLAAITSATPDFTGDGLEIAIHGLINAERARQGLAPLAWNAGLAAVARAHSRDLAEKNSRLTGPDRLCGYPLIHHEGWLFGAYNSDRLRARGIYYFNRTGENIALLPALTHTFTFSSVTAGETALNECRAQQKTLNERFRAALDAAGSEAEKIALAQAEQALREEKFRAVSDAKVARTDWAAEAAVAREAVDGWLNSPGHRANILTPEFDETGIGIAYVNGYVIATQVFITRADCGFETGPCCEKPGYYPYCFTPLSCAQGTCRNN